MDGRKVSICARPFLILKKKLALFEILALLATNANTLQRGLRPGKHTTVTQKTVESSYYVQYEPIQLYKGLLVWYEFFLEFTYDLHVNSSSYARKAN